MEHFCGNRFAHERNFIMLYKQKNFAPPNFRVSWTLYYDWKGTCFWHFAMPAGKSIFCALNYTSNTIVCMGSAVWMVLLSWLIQLLGYLCTGIPILHWDTYAPLLSWHIQLLGYLRSLGIQLLGYLCLDTYAPSNVGVAVTGAGVVAKKSEQHKISKYSHLDSTYMFIPVAVETSGVFGLQAP